MAGQSMRDIKRRIQSVRNTQQVTKAMEMVSAAKLRRAQAQVVAARPYANKIAEVLGRVVEAVHTGDSTIRLEHPLLARRAVRRVLYCAIAADRGLAGGYNANIIRALEAAWAHDRAEGLEVEAVVVGRKLRDYLRRTGRPVRQAYVFIGDYAHYTKAQEIARALAEPYVRGEVDRVMLLYSQFVSAAVARPVTFQLLPVPEEGPRPWPVGPSGLAAAEPVSRAARQPSAERSQPAEVAGPGGGRGVERWVPPYLYHPSASDVVGAIVERYLDVEVFRALLEAKASEHGARMTAMRNASDNAEEMIETLTLSFNRARQASITKEVIEVTTGKEALAALV